MLGFRLKERGKELVNASNELNKAAMAKIMGDVDNVKSMDPATLQIVQNYLKFVEASNEYVTQVNEMMDSIDSKLETLLSRTKGLN